MIFILGTLITLFHRVGLRESIQSQSLDVVPSHEVISHSHEVISHQNSHEDAPSHEVNSHQKSHDEDAPSHEDSHDEDESQKKVDDALRHVHESLKHAFGNQKCPFTNPGYYTDDMDWGTLFGVLVFNLVLCYLWYTRVWSKKPLLLPSGEDVIRPPLVGGQFEERLCGFADDGWGTPICLQALCCVAFRSVDTYVTARVIQRKRAVVCALGLIVFHDIASCFVRPFLRAKVRAHLGGKKSAGLNDFLVNWFCLCCAAAQEAREVDKALNIKTAMCCGLEEYNTGRAIIGNAIQVQPLTEPLLHGRNQQATTYA